MTAKDLKNALLQEAVQGKLVPQIASEGNARDLLEEIRKERLSHGLDFANAKSKKKGKKETALAGSNPCDIPEEEIPFDIPESWCWCRLGEIISVLTDFSANGSYEKLDSNVKMYDDPNYAIMVRTTDLENNFTNAAKYIDESAYKLLSKSTIYGNEIIMNKIGSAGKIYLMPCLNRPATLGRNAFLIRFYELINIPYVFLFLSSLTGNFEIMQHVHGAVTKTITKDAVKSILVPLPPLAEQKRIVAAIEKFMPLIEEYGKKETVLNQLNAQIGTLTKKAILQEAVQGKLVPQIPSEGNAKDLLEEIKAQKAALIKEGKIKKDKPLPEITEDEIPFDIPENWCWVRWGELSDSIQYGYNASAQEKGKIKMVRISDIQENKVLWDTVPYCEIEDEEIPTYLLKENDILFARTGGTVGKSFLVKNILCDAIYAGYLIRTHYNSEKLVPEYLKFFMESELYWSQLKNGTIATAQPNCNGQTLSKMIIPLPPLSEQKRIVEAIEKMLPLCERLGK